MRAVPRLGELCPGICLTTEEKARKTLRLGTKPIDSLVTSRNSLPLTRSEIREKQVRHCPTAVLEPAVSNTAIERATVLRVYVHCLSCSI